MSKSGGKVKISRKTGHSPVFRAPVGLAPTERTFPWRPGASDASRDPAHPHHGCENARVLARALARAPVRAEGWLVAR